MIIGLVLAGGLSSRMGEDKATLRIGGVTLLDLTSRVLRACGASVVAVSGARPGGIPDRWPQAGPVGGIASAAGFLPDADVLVVPVDMPRLGSVLLQPLLDAGERAATCWERHPLPMRFRLDGHARAVLDDMMQRQGRDCSVSGLQARLGVTVLPLDTTDTRLLINCNTPEEWQEATR